MLRRTITLLAGLALAACERRSSFRDYTTPERAVQSFVEAGRVGDMDAVREALVAAEREQGVHCDYSSLGDYTIVRDREIDADHVVVTIEIGPVRSPLACVREGDRWGVTIHGSLLLMQQQLGQGAAPR